MLAEELTTMGVKVSILAEAENPYEVSIEKTHAHGDESIDVYRCWHRKNPDPLAALEAVEQIKPDVVHIQHEWQLFPKTNTILDNLGNMDCRKAMTLHTPDPPGLERLLNQVSLFVDCFVTHWKETSQWLPVSCPYGFPHSAIQTIKHGIRDPKVHPRDDEHYLAKQETGIPAKVPLFFTFGFTSTAKGTKELLQAAAAATLDDECPHFELIVSAAVHPEWANDPQIQKYTKELDEIASKHDNIHLLGYLEEEQIDKYANACDYLIFPYRFHLPVNSCSGAARRVLGYCKPVIVTDEGRLRDLAGGVHGWKVGQYDTDAMIKAIKSAASLNLHGKQYNDYSSSLKELCEVDSWNSVTNQHLSLYQNMCSLYSMFWRRPYNIGVLSYPPTRPLGTAKEFLSFFETEQVTVSEVKEKVEMWENNYTVNVGVVENEGEEE
tara:strand:- start:1136 stop:2446 length:1311 start_codon:yes stop_codon:yes gene_type:complete